MTSQHAPLDHHARACYHAAQRHISARTVAELNRRRIAACAADDARAHGRTFGWPLTAAFASVCALVLALGVLWPPSTPTPEPAPLALKNTASDTSDSLDALDALEAINLTALDEDSEFFLWLSTHEASLLAME